MKVKKLEEIIKENKQMNTRFKKIEKMEIELQKEKAELKEKIGKNIKIIEKNLIMPSLGSRIGNFICMSHNGKHFIEDEQITLCHSIILKC